MSSSCIWLIGLFNSVSGSMTHADWLRLSVLGSTLFFFVSRFLIIHFPNGSSSSMNSWFLVIFILFRNFLASFFPFVVSGKRLQEWILLSGPVQRTVYRWILLLTDMDPVPYSLRVWICVLFFFMVFFS